MSLPLADSFRQPGPHSRGFPVRTLGVVSASVIALPLMATGAQAAIPTPKPTRTLPNALDVAPPYQKGTRCLTSPQPGPVAFAKLLNETYGKHVYGILRTCAAEHGEGRALDWMLNASDPASLALGNALTRWLAAPDSQGRQGAMARRFGINYIIWNRQMWRAYDPSRGWAPYYGVSPHTDHIHISFTWDGAYSRNSWWTGTAVTDYLTGPLNSPPPPPPVMTASGYPWLKQGATGADVALAQKVIGATADGQFGPLTAGALATWQNRYGVTATKELDNATWTKMVGLGAVPSRTTTTPPTSSLEKYAGTTLKLWSKGEAVKALQGAIGKLTVDGSYGPLTEARVKEYQKSKGLAVTGVTDAKVWNALMGKTVAAPPPPTTTTNPLEKYVGTTLRRGSTGEAVKALQKAIGKLTVDGSYGPGTEARVKEYQKSKGLAVTGVTDAKVWNALMGKTAAPPPPTTTTNPLEKYVGTTLRRGSKGDAVKALQKAIGKLTVDGSYGPGTEARVKEYQKSKGLAVTGVTDAKVWNALMGKTVATPPPPTTTTNPLEKYSSLTLKLWSRGEAVKALQKAIGKLTVDGSYGRLTEARVKEYQKAEGLAVTGVTDAKVWNALMGASSGGTTTTPTPSSSTATEFTPLKATTLRVGSSGAAVKVLQRGLGGLVVDGAFGSRTLAAVRAFQTSAKLSATGVVDRKTWDALELRVHPLHPYWGTVLKKGSSGTAVVALQKALRITADGAFGPQTEASVKAAQLTAKLTQTGVVGTVTWKAIEARLPR